MMTNPCWLNNGQQSYMYMGKEYPTHPVKHLSTKDLHVAFAKLIQFLYCSQRVLISIMWRLWELGQQVPPVAII